MFFGEVMTDRGTPPIGALFNVIIVVRPVTLVAERSEEPCLERASTECKARSFVSLKDDKVGSASIP